MTNLNRAAIQSAIGGPDLLSVVELPVPEPSAGEVRVRVHAAALNPVDLKLASIPALADMLGYSVPGGYGSDFAGVVDAVGEGVSSVHPGDRVYASVVGQAVRDYAVVPAESLHAVPAGLALAVAATLPVPVNAASAAIDVLELGPDDVVLIGGASGGVGQIAVQLARRTGATVIGTASEANHEFLRSLGAIPVSYGEGLAERVRAATDRPVTAAADLQGTEVITAALELGVPAQRISSIAAGPNAPEGVLARFAGQALPGSLENAADLVASGEIKVEIAQTYPLDQIHAAIAQLGTGHVRGKIVLTLTDDAA